MDTVAAITIGIFMIGIVFAAGRLTSRVEALEKWQAEVAHRFDRLDDKLESIIELIRGDAV